MTEATVRRDLEVFGDIRSVEMDRVWEGLVTIHFYDLEHATDALHRIQGQHIQQQQRVREQLSVPGNNYYNFYYNLTSPAQSMTLGLLDGHAIWAQFILADCNNQGTLVVFNLNSDVSLKALKQTFEAFGRVKEVREVASEKNMKFVEFYHTRHASEARININGKEINGKKVDVMFSRPKHNRFEPSIKKQEEGCSSSNEYDPSKKELLEMLDRHCIDYNKQIIGDQPQSSYDFLHLPNDYLNKCNLGYGFVNMTSPEATMRLYKAFHHHKWVDDVLNVEEICQVTYAKVQGINALKEHFKNLRFRCEYAPVIFDPPRDGQRPTQATPISKLKQRRPKRVLMVGSIPVVL
ncbi:hypothetical protein QVD17_32739 [Tagetes erecta]|uniref:RRM domain-containing protein n=1 Tax=Tagetes erecta TaxID=13708 RepID=A0AAD8JW13_TARER|nr:hypothetical protein QVD17_32739 [Tagetes erecta]